MKRLLLLVLSLLLILSCVSCAEGESSAAKTTAEEQKTTDPTTQTTGTTEEPATTEEPKAPTVYETKTLKVAEHMNDVFRALGRTYVMDGQLKTDFSCGGIHFVADCEGDVKVQLFTAADSQTKDSRFTVYVDGVRSDLRVQVTDITSGQFFTIASKLPKGIHEFRVINQTQFIWSQASIGEVSIVGEFQAKPADREMLLEFYGDSILNGSNVKMTGGGVNATDATEAFGFLTAEALNADMNLIGCSSIGLTKNSRNFFMKDIWDLAGAQYTGKADKNGILRPEIPKYDFARIPNAVIIEQGVNDKSNASTQAFADAVEEMVNNLRSKYGKDVPIVFPVGYASGAYNTSLPTIIKNLGGEEANLYICQLSNASIPTSEGGDGTHPNIESSKVMAQELTAFLKTILNK
jgi:hypothetical protein